MTDPRRLPPAPDRRCPPPAQFRRTRLRLVGRNSQHIALEGIDGSGKSTLVPLVAAALRATGQTVTTVNYTAPAGLSGVVIRRLYQPEHAPSWWSALLRRWRPLQTIVFAVNARANLLGRNRRADILLSDRSVLTGYASHIGRVPEWFLDLVEPRHAPDLVILLDVPVAEAIRRVETRGDVGPEENRAALTAFLRRYEYVLANPPRRLDRTVVRRIDAAAPPSVVAERIYDAITVAPPARPDHRARH
ncbi:dTMP kinase [Phytoactinopolyspora limicola]|uniref:dTMP kinase n=1 Tax=Phytoactinopolyspora limicola TaxID=2715536 RepID=UPI00140DABF5|nr:dTMP kinase [Phytoactinopolyspora limicola]